MTLKDLIHKICPKTISQTRQTRRLLASKGSF